MNTRHLQPRIIELRLGHGLSMRSDLIGNQLGIRDKRVVAQSIVGGDGIAIEIMERRALENCPLLGNELTLGVLLEIENEQALKSRRKRDGDDHADRTHERGTDNERRKAHGGMHLNGALHDLR